METQEYWDKKEQRTNERIAWQGAKNNAVAIVSAMIQSGKPLITNGKDISVVNANELILEWANWLYTLEPKFSKLPVEEVFPVCAHNEPCKKIQVKKKGENQGKWFYACARPKAQQCKTFIWEDFDNHYDMADGPIEKHQSISGIQE